MRNPVLFVWLIIVIVLLLLMHWRFVNMEQLYDDRGLPGYCGAKPRGAEGVLQRAQPGMVLQAVVLTIRHGDRSAIHALPNTNSTPTWTCRPAGHEQRRAAQSVRVVGLDGRELDRSLLPKTQDSHGLDVLREGHCAPGQLTPRGFAQHVALGRHLGHAFAPLLRAVGIDHRSNLSHPKVYVRSTDYTRTQMSAAALLFGMLPAPLRPPLALPTKIVTRADEENEVMHGVGLTSSSKIGGQDGGGERVRLGRCARAAELTRAQLAAWHDEKEARDSLVELFGAEVRGVASTAVADALYAQACHKMRPPCAAKLDAGGGRDAGKARAGGCVPPALAQAFFRMGDDSYCAKYNGLLGGLQASQLAMQPLLLEIISRLKAAQAQAGTAERLVVLSGHDTVVAQLLAALGGMADAHHCRWPPYASRLVFELWRPTPPAPKRAPSIRVLFNGAVVTHLLPGCVARAGVEPTDEHEHLAAYAGALELCPFDVFVQAVVARVPPGSTFEAQCASQGPEGGGVAR